MVTSVDSRWGIRGLASAQSRESCLPVVLILNGGNVREGVNGCQSAAGGRPLPRRGCSFPPRAHEQGATTAALDVRAPSHRGVGTSLHRCPRILRDGCEDI